MHHFPKHALNEHCAPGFFVRIQSIIPALVLREVLKTIYKLPLIISGGSIVTDHLGNSQNKQ